MVDVTSNFNRRLRDMMSSLNVYLCLKTAIPASTKANLFDYDGNVVLAHCEKHSKDSVKLAGLC